jgi:hypothetical protein
MRVENLGWELKGGETLVEIIIENFRVIACRQ